MLYFNFVSALAQTIPNSIPGKARLFRLLLGFVNFHHKSIEIQGKYNLTYSVPNIKESVAFNIICYGVYENNTIEAVVDLLPTGAIFVDGGANVGAISMPVARLRPDVRVLAVEGDPDIANYLRRNVELNDIPNITVINALLGRDDNSTQTFYKAPDHKFGMGSLGNHFGGHGVALQTRTIDSILAEYEGREIVVKLDIEGAEAIALSGAIKTLKNKPGPSVIFEYQPWAERAIDGQEAGDSQRFLLQLGYTIFKLNESRTPVEIVLTEGHGMLLAHKK